MRSFVAPVPQCGAIAQLGERLDGIQEVVGSIPSGSTIFHISRPIFASLRPPTGRADRPAPGRACEPFRFELFPIGSTNFLHSRPIFASLRPPMRRADRPAPGRACEPFPIGSTNFLHSRRIFASLRPPTGRADRPAPGRACEPFWFEVPAIPDSSGLRHWPIHSANPCAVQ